jgi:hypothetical protein
MSLLPVFIDAYIYIKYCFRFMLMQLQTKHYLCVRDVLHTHVLYIFLGHVFFSMTTTGLSIDEYAIIKQGCL